MQPVEPSVDELDPAFLELTTEQADYLALLQSVVSSTTQGGVPDPSQWVTPEPIPNIPNLPPSPQRPEGWRAWADKVAMHRFQVMMETSLPGEAGEKARQREIDRCRDKKDKDGAMAYLISTYGVIFEARDDVDQWDGPEEGDDIDDEERSSFIPFLPFPFQIGFMYLFMKTLRTRGALGDLAVIKARDMGLSNLICFICATLWMTRSPFKALIMSRNDDLVDKRGDPDALFWKIEYFLKGLPDWLIQGLMPGFDFEKHRKTGQFINPAIPGNTLGGESTEANAGRGGRATVYLYDEFPFMPKFGSILTAGRSATNHRVGVGTVNIDKGMDAYNWVHGRKGYTMPRVVKYAWYEHPLHDMTWLRNERERDTEEGFNREVLMDWFSGVSEWVFPESHNKNPGDHPFVPGAGQVYVAMDDGFDDDFALVWIQYQRMTGRFSVFQGYKNRHQVTDFYGSILTGVPRSDMKYDREALQIMRRQLLLPPQTFVVDSHMNSVEQMTGTSPLEHLATEYGIVPFFDFKKREFKERRLALGSILPLMDFHNHDGAVEVLEAVQRYRWKRQEEGQDIVAEYKKPMHTSESHFVTALEYFAVNWDTIKMSNGSYDKMRDMYVGTPHS
jgi:hypothetical protein